MTTTEPSRSVLTLRPDFATIAAWIKPGSSVLDLGCGDGSLLAHLMAAKGCSGYGIELNDANVQAGIGKGLPILQLNLEDGLALFADGSFDVVLDDGESKKRVHLSRSYNGLYVCPMIWRELDNFSSGSVCMVLASNKYDEEDYYREYAEFMRARWQV